MPKVVHEKINSILLTIWGFHFFKDLSNQPDLEFAIKRLVSRSLFKNSNFKSCNKTTNYSEITSDENLKEQSEKGLVLKICSPKSNTLTNLLGHTFHLITPHNTS